MPFVMAVSSLLLSLLVLELDRSLDDSFYQKIDWMHRFGPEGARAVLTVIASTMVTVASLTFSLTVVALSLTSSQFGPRLLKTFMQDFSNQVVLGTFISTFLYSLSVLREITDFDGSVYVPHVSVFLSFVFAIASVGVLIYFIHHIATSINAEQVIASVSADLNKTIDRLLPNGALDECESEVPRAKAESRLPKNFESAAWPVQAERCGYLQALDYDTLLECAAAADIVIKLQKRAGHYVVPGDAIALVWPKSEEKEIAVQIEKCFLLGSERTNEQDVEYAIKQLVEVAVRALSPGINDPFTAISCVDRLSDSLCRIAAREVPSAAHYDGDNKLRIVQLVVSKSEYINAAFNQIRQNSSGVIAVAIRLLESLNRIAARANEAEILHTVEAQAEAIVGMFADGGANNWDFEDISQRYKQVMNTIADAQRGTKKDEVNR